MFELVTPSHYADTIAQCLKEAKKAGLTIPVAYNSNGYGQTGNFEIIPRIGGYLVAGS